MAADNFALECWPAALGRPFITRAEREQGAGDSHSEIMRRALIGLLGNADAVLYATETASDRRGHIRLSPKPDAVALSLITAGQRGIGVLDTSHRACRQLAPERRYITWLVT